MLPEWSKIPCGYAILVLTVPPNVVRPVIAEISTDPAMRDPEEKLAPEVAERIPIRVLSPMLAVVIVPVPALRVKSYAPFTEELRLMLPAPDPVSKLVVPKSVMGAAKLRLLSVVVIDPASETVVPPVCAKLAPEVIAPDAVLVNEPFEESLIAIGPFPVVVSIDPPLAKFAVVISIPKTDKVVTFPEKDVVPVPAF